MNLLCCNCFEILMVAGVTSIVILLTMILSKTSGGTADNSADEKLRQEIFDSLNKIKSQLEKTV